MGRKMINQAEQKNDYEFINEIADLILATHEISHEDVTDKFMEELDILATKIFDKTKKHLTAKNLLFPLVSK